MRLGAPRLGSGRDRQQQRRDVHARGQLRARPLGRAGQAAARILDDQRHPDALLVRARPLAPQAVRGAVLAVVGGEHDDRVGRHLRAAFAASCSTRPMWLSTSSCELHVEVEERRASAPELGAREWDRAERCSPRCPGGRAAGAALTAPITAPASRSSAAAARRGARRCLGGGTRSLHAYHHAMSWGFTNDTVVHHGPPAPAAPNQLGELVGDPAVHAPALPGAPSGEGYMPPANP